VAAALCDRLGAQVGRTIRRLVGPYDPDREDLAQLALIELVKGIDRYRGECSLDTWAQSVAAHVVFKHIRRRKIERRIFAELIVDGVGALEVVQIESASTMRQLLLRVGEHLDALPEDRAWAFVLHDLLGYDLREVAQMTKASVAAAQSRLSRGRRDLHRRIADDAELAEMMDTAEQSKP
jgi:RNA polymerase sigma-70 factor (ECF subfamily)